MRVEIPGGHAELRDKATVRGRMLEESYHSAFIPILKKIPKTANPGDPIDRTLLDGRERMILHEFQLALVASRLKDWTLPYAVPITVDEVGESEAFDESDEGKERFAIIATKASELWFANQRPVFEANPDKQSPTSPSTDSEESLSEVEGLSSEASQNGGGSIATDGSSLLPTSST